MAAQILTYLEKPSEFESRLREAQEMARNQFVWSKSAQTIVDVVTSYHSPAETRRVTLTRASACLTP
jgi:hypothetical protein